MYDSKEKIKRPFHDLDFLEEDDDYYYIPYKCSEELESLHPVIQSAMREIEDNSSIKFKDVSSDASYNGKKTLRLFDRDDEKCIFSSPQLAISLGKGYETYGTVLHSLFHSLGFQHEHKRLDRDVYLIIYGRNIKLENLGEFEKLSWDDYGWRDFSFDVHSIMLYGSKACGKDGLITLMKKNGDSVLEVYDKRGLSEMDKYKLWTLQKNV